MESALNESITQLTLHFHKRMAEFEAKLQGSTTPPSTTSLASEFAAFKQLITASLTNLQCQIEAIARNVDSLEMRGRRKILLLHGVSEQNKEGTAQVVADILKTRVKLNHVSGDNIKQCQRLGRSSTTHKPRPILFKLREVDVRDQIWFKKTNLKDSGITISEFLMKTRHDVFMAARRKYGVKNCWTKQGNVFVVGMDKQQHRVTSLMELNKLDENAEKIPVASKPAAAKLKRTAATKKQ